MCFTSCEREIESAKESTHHPLHAHLLALVFRFLARSRSFTLSGRSARGSLHAERLSQQQSARQKQTDRGTDRQAVRQACKGNGKGNGNGNGKAKHSKQRQHASRLVLFESLKRLDALSVRLDDTSCVERRI